MLYYEQPYLQEVEVEVLKKDGRKYLLSDTILYPGGGGQPEDKGYALCGDKKFKIRHLGNLWHEIDGDCTERKIKIVLDWERRYQFMCSHTAEHTFFRALQNRGAVLGKVSIGEEESAIIFEGDISIEDILAAEGETRKLIKENREVRTFWISKEKIKKYPQLRIKLDRIKDERIRLVEIKSHDISACKGIHVAKLSEIGDFCITHVRMGKKKEVKFVVGDKARRSHEFFSQTLRKLAWKYNIYPDRMEKYIINLRHERDKSFEALKMASESIPFEEEVCGDKRFFHLIFYGGNRKIIVRRMMELVKEDKNIVVYGDLYSNAIICAFSQELSLRDKIFEVLKKFDGKGGGKGNFINASVKDIPGFIKALRNEICKE